jgi:hypothetical protein
MGANKLRRRGPGGCPGRASLVGAGRRLRFLAQRAVAPELVEADPIAAGNENYLGGSRPATKWTAQRRASCSLPDDQFVKKLLRGFGIFMRVHQPCSTVTYLQTTDPEQHILRNIRRVISDSLQVSRGENEMKIRRG